MAVHIWRPAVAGPVAEVAVRRACQEASRLRSVDHARLAADAAVRESNHPELIHWVGHGMSQGNAGLALMASYLDECFPDEGWDAAGLDHLTAAAESAESAPHITASLFGGLSGVGFAALSLARGGARYRKLLNSIDTALVPLTDEMSENLRVSAGGVGVGSFDAISGISGVAAYLLARLDAGATGIVPTLSLAVEAMVAISEERDGLPKWWTPPHLMFDKATASHYPVGNLNCGLAHGIPGPLAAMSLALSAGMEIPGLRDGIERLAEWLVAHQLKDAWGVTWPTVVPLAIDAGGSVRRSVPLDRLRSSRTAWCYGSPGIARALWLAGKALGNASYCDLALSAIRSVIQKPVPVRQIDSPTFCHGVAGLLQIILRFWHDTGATDIRVAAEGLVRQLNELYDPRGRLGFLSLDKDGQWLAKPGLLEGSPGVVLALFAASQEVTPRWDRLFLLS